MTGFHPAINFYQNLAGPRDSEEQKINKFRTFAAIANKEFVKPDYAALTAAIDTRQQALIAHAAATPGVVAETFRARLFTRLSIGMSHGRLWDSSFQIHPVYGLPYLPASAIKGALLHFRIEEEGEDAAREELNVWFGDQDNRALVTILDAFPVFGRKFLFTEDILNKHHENYYEVKEKNQAPADYNNPSPVKFLAVATNVEFRFGFTIETDREGRPAPSREQCKQLIRDCLLYAGFGAKTRKGYGRMNIL